MYLAVVADVGVYEGEFAVCDKITDGVGASEGEDDELRGWSYRDEAGHVRVEGIVKFIEGSCVVWYQRAISRGAGDLFAEARFDVVIGVAVGRSSELFVKIEIGEEG